MAMKAIKEMKREEVEEELTTLWSTIVPKEHNIMMLKSLLQEKREEGGANIKKKEGMPTRKAELVQMATKMEIPLTGNETNGKLQRLIQTKRDRVVVPTGEKTMPFGKYKDEKYEEIYKKDKEYCEWAVMTVIENGKKSHPSLVKFAEWIDTVEGKNGKTKEDLIQQLVQQEKTMKEMRSQIASLQAASSTDSDEEFEVIEIVESLKALPPRTMAKVKEMMAEKKI